MTRWADDESTREPRPTRSLAADLMGIRPASTFGREMLAALLQIGAVTLLVFVIFPDRLPELSRWVLLGATAVFFVFRTAAGIPKWRPHR